MARDEVAKAAETVDRRQADHSRVGRRPVVGAANIRGRWSIGESLRDDADLRDKVDNWIIRAAQHLVSEYGVEITAIITETIERWDADEASRRIECTSAVTCNSSGSMAPWWVRWRV